MLNTAGEFLRAERYYQVLIVAIYTSKSSFVFMTFLNSNKIKGRT